MKVLALALMLTTIVGCSSSSKQNLASEEQAPTKKATEGVTVSKERKKFENQPANVFSCTRTADTRQIEIQKADPKGCELWYSSYGSRKKVASSVHGESHCVQVKEKIQSNLEQAGFKCAEPARATATEAKN